MDKNDFKLSGFARFYRSLPRFHRDINNADALKLTYVLYTTVLDAHRRRNPGEAVKEKSESEFYKSIKLAEAKPYRTEVQLYRAMEAIRYYADDLQIKDIQIPVMLELVRMMYDTEMRFYKAFDMEIDDSRTIYSMCAMSLVPGSDEPGVCLAQDWRNTAPA